MANKNPNYSVNRGNYNIINGRFRQKNEDGGYIIPTLLALAFSLGGLLFGSLILAAGFYASVSGLLIALLAKIGWEMGKGKIGGIKMFVIILITIVMSVLTEFVGVYFGLMFEGLELSIDTYLNLVFNVPEVLEAFLIDIAILLVFAVIGMVMVIFQVREEGKLKKELLEKGLPLFEDAPKTEDPSTPDETKI